MKLYWYIVYWRNEDFARSKQFKPWKVGHIFGCEEAYDEARMGRNRKTRNFEPVNKLQLLFIGSKEDFQEWIESK